MTNAVPYVRFKAKIIQLWIEKCVYEFLLLFQISSLSHKIHQIDLFAQYHVLCKNIFVSLR